VGGFVGQLGSIIRAGYGSFEHLQISQALLLDS
jgi:hypothetical protein